MSSAELAAARAERAARFAAHQAASAPAAAPPPTLPLTEAAPRHAATRAKKLNRVGAMLEGIGATYFHCGQFFLSICPFVLAWRLRVVPFFLSMWWPHWPFGLVRR